MNPTDDPTIELILKHLAQKYGLRFIAGDLERLARELAKYHVLVLLAERAHPDSQVEVPQAVQECHDLYVQMYQLLLRVSFPSLTKVSSLLYHGRSTLIIVFEGEARLIIELLAGYIAPYVAARRGTRSVANIELYGLIEKVLDKLDLGELDAQQYSVLRDEGTAILKQMLRMALRQLPLTPFDEPFFDEIEAGEPAAVNPSRPNLDNLPGQFVKPFADDTLQNSNGDVPQFIRDLWGQPQTNEGSDKPDPEAREPRQKLPSQAEDWQRRIREENSTSSGEHGVSPQEEPPTGETGPLRPERGSGERSRSIPPPAQSGNGLPPPPLPPPRRKGDNS